MSDLRERHDRVMGAGAPMFYDDPVELVSGDGVWLHAADGRRYLDMYNNVPCVGHANPRVAKAIADQMATLNVHSRYLHESVIAYGERLLGLHHDGIESMIIACTGTEAVDLALGIARLATGNANIICTDATYHGNSPTVGALTRLPAGDSRPGVRSITHPQTFRRARPDTTDAELTEHHLEELAATIATCRGDGGFAGLIMCPILANEGLPVVPPGWFEAATAMVRDAGGLLIADEVQAGFGRSGRWWGYQASGFEPDIATMGKPMGNGLPVSAVAASRALIERFRNDRPYFNTYASSPLQAAAAMAVIDEIQDRDLVAHVDRLGADMAATLTDIAAGDPRMGQVRGVGMFIGIDWVYPGTTDPDVEGAARIVEALKERDVLVGRAGHHRNVIKIRPPLVFDQTHADVFFEAWRAALGA